MKPSSDNKILFVLLSISVFAILVLPLYFKFYLYPTTSQKIITGRETNAQQLAAHLAKMLNKRIDERLDKEAISASFIKMIESSKDDFNLVKVRVFSPEGEILYSTKKDEVGNKNDKKYFHEVVAKGEYFTKIVKKNEESLEGQVLSRDVVETYVPLMHSTSFMGAFELYYDITDNLSDWKTFFTQAQVTLLAITLILLISVFIAASKANRYLNQRISAEQRLQKSNNELSVLYEISQTLNHSIELDTLLPLILDKIIELDQIKTEKKGVIFLIKEGVLTPISSIGIDDAFLEAHAQLNIGECNCGKVAQNGEIAIVTKCPFEISSKKERQETTLHTHIVIPLKSANQIIGILHLYAPEAIEIKENTKRLLAAIGSQIGIAIMNAQLYEETLFLSMHDPLTKLANRRLMESSLDKQLAIAQRYNRNFSVLMVDIDYFKKYNDTYGHEAGDSVLFEVAQTLQNQVRDADLVSRYGGEEFLIILNETKIEPGCSVAERLRKNVKSKTEVTVSIGIACYIKGMTVDTLINQADQALYTAKEKGRNRVFCAYHENTDNCELVQEMTA